MSYNNSNVKIIAEQLRWAKDKGYSTALLLGAGMSFSADIPLANGMIEEVKKQFPQLTSNCEKETYPAYMSLLAPAQRRKLIGSFVDNAKINLAHLYLGALVKENYVDRILTTNFDPLVVRSLAQFNLYPAVYDFAASQAFIPGEAAQLSVFYLHGQRDGFVLLNTEEEVDRHSEKIKNVFQDVGRGRCWIVIGYSGENDPVFERLAEVEVFQNKLFWVGYEDEEPKEHVAEKILKPKNKFGYYVKSHGADSFFLELAKELDLPEPQIISKPFSHLKEAINTIAEFSIDDKLANPTKETKKWIDIAIKGFEEGKGFEHIVAAQKSTIDIDEMIRKTRDIWAHGRFNQIDEIIESVLSSGNGEANKYLAFALNNWGTALLNLAKTKEGEEAEALSKQSFEKYEQALKIKPDYHEALNNWGNALSDLAKTKEGEEAEALFEQSFEKLMKAEEIEEGIAAYDLACVYALVGKIKKSLIWLEKGLKMKQTPSRRHILADNDIDKIKDTDDFKRLINLYRPE
ncbi:MAG: Plant specific mitochondrial import receptor subunit TOM20 [Candidatus Syntrophoarchaeum sp. GoM_oil]|nr:MAG: Plant specific mitochondrial import receptor subunit TOM20 [Candidatus Syntrophoarchaeum sp. GoM_oil]